MGWNMREEAERAHLAAKRGRRAELAAIAKRHTAANRKLADAVKAAKKNNSPQLLIDAEAEHAAAVRQVMADYDAIGPLMRYNITDMAVYYVVVQHSKDGTNPDGQPRVYSATNPGGPRTTTLGRGLYIQDIKDILNGARGVEAALARLVEGFALIVVTSGKAKGAANVYYCPTPGEIRALQAGDTTPEAVLAVAQARDEAERKLEAQARLGRTPIAEPVTEVPAPRAVAEGDLHGSALARASMEQARASKGQPADDRSAAWLTTGKVA